MVRTAFRPITQPRVHDVHEGTNFDDRFHDNIFFAICAIAARRLSPSVSSFIGLKRKAAKTFKSGSGAVGNPHMRTLRIRSNVNKMAEVNVRCSLKYRDGKKVFLCIRSGSNVD